MNFIDLQIREVVTLISTLLVTLESRFCLHEVMRGVWFTVSCLCAPSYKLWYNYLRLRRKQVKGKVVTDPVYEEVNNAFERALVFLHKVHTHLCPL